MQHKTEGALRTLSSRASKRAPNLARDSEEEGAQIIIIV